MPIFLTRKPETRMEKIVFPLLPIRMWENAKGTRTYFYKNLFGNKMLMGVVEKEESLICCPREK